MSGEALAWSYKNAKNSDGKSHVFQMHSKKTKHTHRLDLHMHLSYPLWQEVKLGERHDSRERRAFFWWHPSIRNKWTGCSRVTQGLIDLTRSSDLCCSLDQIPISSMSFSLPTSQLLISLHGWNPPLEEDNQLDWAFQLLLRMFTDVRRRVCLCVFPVLARLGSVTFELIFGGITAAGLCTHRWGAWPEGRSGIKQLAPQLKDPTASQ